MKTSLDCIPCILRQALEAARMASPDPAVHEQLVREVLHCTAGMDLSESPPAMAQRIHRRLRQISGVVDPYRPAKQRLNRMALGLLPVLQGEVAAAADPLMMAARLAIAGNVIDLGANGNLREADVHQAVQQALTESFWGEADGFRQAVAGARSILYLADNAGEIAFDRLLIEQLGPQRVTLVVRGGPVINDATLEDARAVGLEERVVVIENGSDAPGTLLADCDEDFRLRFREADLVLAKGQGNFESLNECGREVFFLFKAKCPVVADHVGQPAGTQMLVRTPVGQKAAG
ncbi:MAG: DUF89 family protein [Anaerolineales bacterium]|nr:DUF89 family protein [Anaerolineales bacterium]